MTFIQAFIKSPYGRLMRLHQPVGIWLLLWPCWWSVTLAEPGRIEIILLILFAIGAITMRSASCIINDLWDRDIDARVARTRTRPLASGELKPAQAYKLLAILLTIALLTAVLLGPYVLLWSALALPLVITYPLMKRITWWPQAFLGLTFNWGALLGAVAVYGAPTHTAWLLYAAGFFWTLGYDTIYAYQDIRDDAEIGVKSTARRLGANGVYWIAGFYGVAWILLLLAGLSAGKTLSLIGPLLPAAAHFTWQIKCFDSSQPAECGQYFRSNVWAGGLIFLAYLVG